MRHYCANISDNDKRLQELPPLMVYQCGSASQPCLDTINSLSTVLIGYIYTAFIIEHSTLILDVLRF